MEKIFEFLLFSLEFRSPAQQEEEEEGEEEEEEEQEEQEQDPENLEVSDED